MLLTTNVNLSMSRILEVNALRWGIEVYFNAIALIFSLSSFKFIKAAVSARASGLKLTKDATHKKATQ